MIIYPDVIYSSSEYEHEVAAHADDPFSLAIVDIFWHGTRQYQSFIKRDGVTKHQDFLRRVSVGVTQWQDMMTACESGCCELEARTLEHRRSLFNNPSLGPSNRVGKQVEVIVTTAVETFREIEANNAASIKKLREQAKLARGQIQSYKSMVERLTAALVMYQHEHLGSLSGEAEPLDAANQVNTAPVSLQAGEPAPEIKVKRPNAWMATIGSVRRQLASGPA